MFRNRIALLALLIVLVTSAWAETRIAPPLDISSIRQLPVQEGGRAKPFDTWCREALLQMYDEESYAGWDPVNMVLSMAFQPEKWRGEKIVALSYRPHRIDLNLEKDERPELDGSKSRKRSSASFDEIVNHPKFQAMLENLEAARTTQKELTDSQKEDSRLYGRVSTVNAIFMSKAIKIIPFAGKPEQSWMAPGEMEGAPIFAAYVSAWKQVGEAYVSGDQATFDKSVASLIDVLSKVDAKNYPAPKTIALEVNYNIIRPFRSAATLYAGVFFLLLSSVLGASWILLAFGIVFAIGGFTIVTGAGLPASLLMILPGWLKASVAPALVVSGLAIVLGFGARGARWLVWLAVSLMLVGWAMHSGGLVARVIISERGPISNMFESMIYLGWGAITFSLLFSVFHGVTYFGMASCAVGAVMLLSAENSFDPFISPLVPVLRSYWLWIHVQIIMLGYAGLSMAIAMAHLRLLFTLGGDSQLARARSIDPILHRSIQIGAACLGTGIVLGGIWADYSWGRYWGWDPKETWSLITFLCYMALLHGRFAGWLSGAAVALGCVLGLFPLLMTYYGVNFLLVGLHSYASADMNAGATFLDKLLTVPLWLSLLVLFELVLTQIVDAVLLRDGRMIAGTLILQAAFLSAVWAKVPAWVALVVIAQGVLSAVAWIRRDQLLKSGAASRLVIVMGALLLLPGVLQSTSLLGAAIVMAGVYAAIAGRSEAGVPAAVKSSEAVCARCANDAHLVQVGQKKVAPELSVRTAIWCEPCTQIYCGKCCGLSQTASKLEFAKCPDCEKPVVWANGEHQAKVKAKPEHQFQPDVA